MMDDRGHHFQKEGVQQGCTIPAFLYFQVILGNTRPFLVCNLILEYGSQPDFFCKSKTTSSFLNGRRPNFFIKWKMT